MTEKEETIKDVIAIVRAFCGEEMRRNANLPKEQAEYRGGFITIIESDLINQIKKLK